MTNWVLHIGTAALLVGFSVQAYIMMAKFNSGRLTVTSSVYYRPELAYPALSVCPGFKKDKIGDYVWPILLGSRNRPSTKAVIESITEFPKNEEEALKHWNDITFNAEDFISDGIHLKNDRDQTFLTTDEMAVKNDVIWYEKFSTLSGKCYIFHLEKHAVDSEAYYYILDFDMSNVPFKKFNMAFHHEKAVSGLNSVFWPLPVMSVTVEDGGNIDHVLYKKIINAAEEITGGGEIVSEDEYMECVLKFIGDRIGRFDDRMLSNNCSTPCDFPPFYSLTNLQPNNSLPFCGDVPSLVCMIEHVYNVLFGQYQLDAAVTSVCPPPNERAYYQDKIRIDSAQVFDSTFTGRSSFAYFSTEESIEESYQLMDAFSTLAALGGSLGMFVGWSLRDLIKAIIYLFNKFCYKNITD